MRLSVILNFLIRSFFLFLIFYLWGTFFINGFFLTFLIAFLLTCIVNYAWFFFAIKRKKKITLTREELDHADKVILNLEFMTKQETLVLFYGALKKKFLIKDLNQTQHKEPDIQIHHDKISINSYRGDSLAPADTESPVNIFSMFHKDVTKQDIVNAIANTKTGAKTVILAKIVPTELKLFFERLNCSPIFIEAEQAYSEILKPTQTFPQFKIEVKKSTRLTLRQLRTIAFQRRKAKGYILVGILVLATSFIVRPSIFYVVMATIIFGMAAISFFRGGTPNKGKLW
ncbi:MAG: hypothetical protein FWE01_00485 [Firmicutes bacterium]|nr:hypothetical protein [Bacillota bacterium]